MGKLSRSWSLVSSSWQVLRHDKELLALPAISAVVAAICVAPFFGAAFLATPTTTPAAGSEESVGFTPVTYVLMFIGYLVGSYVTIFFQSALIHAANERLSGGSPTLGSALAGAYARAGHILPWALLSATVSVVLRAVQERTGILGRLVIGLVGMAWTLVTFLVLPILVIGGTGVKDALSRSAGAFKRTWGENVVGNAGIGVVGGLAMVAGVLVCAPIIVVGAQNDLIVVTSIGVALAVIWVILVSVGSAALSGVFQTALYRFAVLGEESDGFSADQIHGAFRRKRAGRSIRG